MEVTIFDRILFDTPGYKLVWKPWCYTVDETILYPSGRGTYNRYFQVWNWDLATRLRQERLTSYVYATQWAHQEVWDAWRQEMDRSDELAWYLAQIEQRSAEEEIDDDSLREWSSTCLSASGGSTENLEQIPGFHWLETEGNP